MRTDGLRFLRLLAVAALSSLLLACSPLERQYEAGLLLADLQAQPGAETRLARRAGDPEIATVTYTVNDRHVEADLYRPPGQARGNLVLIHGFTEYGRNDLRLRQFATSLSRTGYRVLAPDVPALMEFDWGVHTVDDVLAAQQHLHERDASADLPSGVATLSLMSGPVVLATHQAHEAGWPLPDFLLLIGGYYDLEAWLAWLTAGEDPIADVYNAPASPEGPRPEGRWLLLGALADRADTEADREALRAISERRTRRPEADVSEWMEGLSDEPRAIYDLLANEDPDQVDALIDALPDRWGNELRALDLARRDDLPDLPEDLRVILIHGREDRVIPFSHARGLEAHFPNSTLHSASGLAHVDLDPGVFDIWRLWRASADVLRERQ